MHSTINRALTHSAWLCVAGCLTFTASAQAGKDAKERRVAKVIQGLRTELHTGDGTDETFTLAERMVLYNVPGLSICVVDDGKIHWNRGYGVANKTTDVRITPSTMFQAASISKPLVAAAVLLAAQSGKIDLDTDVNRYLVSWKLPNNEFTKRSAVTVEYLLSHMGGTTVSGFMGYSVGEEVPTLLEVLEGVQPANTDPIRVTEEPGSLWRYSGGGYCVLQQMMVDIYQRPFQKILYDLLLAPLDMRSSTLQQPLGADMARLASPGHDEAGDKVEGGWRIYPELAAAGLWSTSADLARFGIAVQKAADGAQGALLDPFFVDLLVTPRYGSFSLGLLVRQTGGYSWFTFNGGNAGYRCLMYFYVEAGQGAVVMTNSDNGSLLAAEIINSIAVEYNWPEFQPEG